MALYDATAGPNWANSDNWLTDNPLGESYGVWQQRVAPCRAGDPPAAYLT